MKENKDAPLSVEVKEDRLVISIGIDTLAYCFERSESNNPYDEETGDFKQIERVASPMQFAKDVATELMMEEEDGSTPLNLLLDKMCEEAVNQGSNGLEYKEDE
jgi:hypothetical protein